MIDQEKPRKPKSKTWLIYSLILIAVFGAALALRVVPMYQAVFGSGQVNLQGVDGIYHLRLVENLLHHFPFRIAFDPYTYFPNGQDVIFAPLYDLLAGFCAWVVGLGSPTQHTIEVVAVWFPAVLGALVTVPIFFIAKTLWNKTAGFIAAMIIAILPGTFLFRSRLGFFDHHVAEILFSTVAIAFLFIGLKQVREHPVSFNDVRNKNWKLLARPLLFGALAGIALGAYLLAWVGGLLFVFLFFCFAIVMFIIDHLKKQSSDYICILGIPVFLLALIVILPLLHQINFADLYVASLLIGIIGLIVLALISKLMDLKNINRFFYPLTIVGIGVIGFIILDLVFPTLTQSIMAKFLVFRPDVNGLTVAEERPMLSSQGHFTLKPLWTEFTTGAFVAPLGFILLVVGYFRKIESEKILLGLWTLLVFIATTGQVRFAAYLAAVVAILCAYFYSEIILLIKKIFDRSSAKSAREATTAVSHSKHKQKKQAHPAHDKMISTRSKNTVWSRILAISLSVILVFLVGILPDIKPAIANAGSNSGVNSEWKESLLWMKANTPEPFGDADFYYQRYVKPANDQYVYPASAYGVMAWWDYGHMITEIAHRIPNANPYQAGAASAATYFISQDEKTANQLLDVLGSKYVVIDYEIAIPFGVSSPRITGNKFYAMPTWAGTDVSNYCDIFYQPNNGGYNAFPLYYPEYYYCLVSRLYNFHGAAVTPQNSSTVISFTVDSHSGQKIIQSKQTFATYEEASAFLKKQNSDNYRIVGTSPFSSPVPLAKLDHYKEVYKSKSAIPYNNQNTGASYIEIFEYTR